MKYEIINTDKWDRRETFRHFIDDLRCVMSLTADVDVTPLIGYCRDKGLKFYPAMIWVVSKIINAHAEFKYGWNERHELIAWDAVSPAYTHFYPAEEKFVKLFTEYADDLPVFHDKFMADKEKYRDLREFDLRDLPANTFDVSCLPWIRYKNFDLHVFDGGVYLAPVVTWGKYAEENGKTVMPLTMNVHHAVADGYHVARFFGEVQALIGCMP